MNETKSMCGRTRLIALALMLGCVGHTVAQPPPAKKATFAMHIRLERDTVKPGAEVLVNVDLTNTSNVPIYLFHARRGRAPYDVRAWDRGGRPAPLTDQERVFRGEVVAQDKGKPMRIRTGGGYAITIPPGQTAKDGLIIQDQVDFSQPGEYTIQLERMDHTTKVLVKSNTVTLTVANDPSPPR